MPFKDPVRRREHSREYQRRPESKAYHRAYYAANKDRERDKWLRRRWGMTAAEWDAKLQEQGGGCAICKSHEPGAAHRGFTVDHDHATGAVRGILCHHCNKAIGMLKDSPEILRAAAAYIEAHEERHARDRNES